MRVSKGHHCSAIGCFVNSGANPGISMFRFPKEKTRSKTWVVNCRRKDLDDKSTDYLSVNCCFCSNHFEQSQFMNTQRNKLVWNAVPTIFPELPNPPKQIATKRKIPQRLPVAAKRRRLTDHQPPAAVTGCATGAVSATVSAGAGAVSATLSPHRHNTNENQPDDHQPVMEAGQLSPEPTTSSTVTTIQLKKIINRQKVRIHRLNKQVVNARKVTQAREVSADEIITAAGRFLSTNAHQQIKL